MVDLHQLIKTTSPYLHRFMVEVAPATLIEICERAIAAESLAEARRKGSESVVNELVSTCKENVALKNTLADALNHGTRFALVTEDSIKHVERSDVIAQQPKLAVWYGSMRESNGKANWTAVLHRADSKGLDLFTDGITIARSEYPDRVRYEANFVKWLIGDLPEKPYILDYDSDKHSGYIKGAQ